MRIISGRLGGRILRDVPASGVRPAMGKTREALFSMLEARGLEWEGKMVLDLFAGAGSLAFEALSRGARGAWLVENGSQPIQALERNAEELGLRELCRIIPMDVKRFLRKPPPVAFDLVFIDPPYGKNLAPLALKALCAEEWLNGGAFVTAEIENRASAPAPAILETEARRIFGQTCVMIWKKK